MGTVSKVSGMHPQTPCPESRLDFEIDARLLEQHAVGTEHRGVERHRVGVAVPLVRCPVQPAMTASITIHLRM